MWTSEEKSRDQVTILAGVKYLAGSPNYRLLDLLFGRRLEPYQQVEYLRVFSVHVYPSSESCHVFFHITPGWSSRRPIFGFGFGWIETITHDIRKGMTRVFIVFSTIGTGATANRRSCARLGPLSAAPLALAFRPKTSYSSLFP